MSKPRTGSLKIEQQLEVVRIAREAIPWGVTAHSVLQSLFIKKTHGQLPVQIEGITQGKIKTVLKKVCDQYKRRGKADLWVYNREKHLRSGIPLMNVSSSAISFVTPTFTAITADAMERLER